MRYFGTDTKEYGHYTWDLGGDRMIKIGLLPRDTPFNPEELTKGLQKGETIFYQGGGFTAVGISGSCKDERSGTKSVFWINENTTKNELMQMILSNKLAAEIISLMPFTVKW